MNVMLCFFAFSMISFATIFLMKSLKNVTFLKTKMKDQTFCSYLTILIHLLVNQLRLLFSR